MFDVWGLLRIQKGVFFWVTDFQATEAWQEQRISSNVRTNIVEWLCARKVRLCWCEGRMYNCFFRLWISKVDDVNYLSNLKPSHVFTNLGFYKLEIIPRWWFPTFLIFTINGRRFPFWLAHIFQMGWWKTTNQIQIEVLLGESWESFLWLGQKWVKYIAHLNRFSRVFPEEKSTSLTLFGGLKGDLDLFVSKILELQMVYVS